MISPEGNTTDKAKKTGSDTTTHVADVINKEREYLGLDGKKTSGFAISGGGIRSASFGLGVMQALVGNNQLEKMDYMSTVSGGGYLGAALTWALKQGGKNAGTTKEKFPLGKKGMWGRQDEQLKEKHPNSHNNGLLDFIRQHSSYLMPTGNLGLFSFVGVVIRSMMLSLLVYFGVLVIVMVLSRYFGFFESTFLSRFINNHSPASFPAVQGIFIPVSIVLILLFVILSLLYSLRTVREGESGFSYRAFIAGQVVVGYLWKFSLVGLLIGALPLIQGLVEKGIEVASASISFGSLVGIWQYVKAQKNEKSSGMLSGLMIYAGAFALTYGLLLLAFIVSAKFIEGDGGLHIAAFAWLCGITLLFGFCVNLNLIGPHRIWRDRLMEAFMPDKDAVNHNKWKPAKEADSAMMEDMCDDDNRRPYHIVNTNIILGNSKQVTFRGRGGDNFIISRFYCGSEATGWRTTKTFQKNAGRGITLATAMATSAAALNPDAAVSGEGATRGTMVSILLSILNLRLGYWTVNPGKDVRAFRPNFFNPGIRTEILRLGFKETANHVLLSDGGHFENLALYELIRRKVDLIVVSDGGADGAFNFDDLANAVEKVRVDFGAKIAFIAENKEEETEDWGPNGILFDAASSNVFQKKYEIAQRGYAIANVTYNDGTKGKLVYIKLAMINELPTDVYSYKGINPTFPHQSTADQFFDEKQFEAYRELGYTAAWKMMESKEGMKLFPKKAE